MINNKYEKYKIKKIDYNIEQTNYNIEEICNPPNFELQPQQLFLPEYLYDNIDKINGLLVYHNIGSGKTCTAIQICEKFKYKKKIICVLPASLIGNFINELYSKCGNYNDINDIQKIYTIYSHHLFVKNINLKMFDLNNTLLIIDEIQNMISENGVFYDTLKTYIYNANNTFKLIMLTGTPIFDNPNEIALTLNLLKPKKLLPVNDEFNITFLKKFKNNKNIIYKFINQELFIELTKGLVSYYKGAPLIAYPKLFFQTVECIMDDFQKGMYIMTLSNNKKKKQYDMDDMFDISENSFYIKSRMVSNIAFPNQKIDKTGYKELVKELTINNIKVFSIKFYKLIENIKNSTNKIFIYSNFILCGLQSITLILDLYGYKNYMKHGVGKKRYCIWSGNETKEIKEKIKTEFNKIENLNGKNIQIFLGSPAAKEGITLKNVREVHIMEPYWNLSRLKQIMGRAYRHCVHNDLPEDERTVNVYLYLANHIDEHIWSMAKNKDKIIREFESNLKNNAIDCNIFYNRNNSIKYPINCHT